MRIEVIRIPDEGKELSYQEDPVAIALSPDLELERDIDVHVTLYRTDRTVVARGEIKAVPELVCGRCSVRFFLPLLIRFDQLFVPKEPVRPVSHLEERRERREGSRKKEPPKEAEEEEPEEGQADEYYFEGGTLSLDEMIREQIFLALPMRPLCFEDCKGLCPGCGVD